VCILSIQRTIIVHMKLVTMHTCVAVVSLVMLYVCSNPRHTSTLTCFPIHPYCYYHCLKGPLSQNINVLGVTFASCLSLNKHTSAICQSIHFHVRVIRHIQSALINDMAAAFSVTLVQSPLNYASSTLHRTSLSVFISFSVFKTR